MNNPITTYLNRQQISDIQFPEHCYVKFISDDGVIKYGEITNVLYRFNADGHRLRLQLRDSEGSIYEMTKTCYGSRELIPDWDNTHMPTEIDLVYLEE